MRLSETLCYLSESNSRQNYLLFSKVSCASEWSVWLKTIMRLANSAISPLTISRKGWITGFYTRDFSLSQFHDGVDQWLNYSNRSGGTQLIFWRKRWRWTLSLTFRPSDGHHHRNNIYIAFRTRGPSTGWARKNATQLNLTISADIRSHCLVILRQTVTE